MSDVWILAAGLAGVLAGVALVVWGVRWGVVVRLGRGRAECRRCLYSLDGVIVTASRCPECGWEIDERRARRGRFVGSRLKLGVGAVLMAAGCVGVGSAEFARAERAVWLRAPVGVLAWGVDRWRWQAWGAAFDRFHGTRFSASPRSDAALIVREALRRGEAWDALPGFMRERNRVEVDEDPADAISPWNIFLEYSVAGLREDERASARWLSEVPRWNVFAVENGGRVGRAVITARFYVELEVRGVRVDGDEVVFSVLERDGVFDDWELVEFALPDGWESRGGELEIEVELDIGDPDAGALVGRPRTVRGVLPDVLMPLSVETPASLRPAARVGHGGIERRLRGWGEDGSIALFGDESGRVGVELMGEGIMPPGLVLEGDGGRVVIAARFEAVIGGVVVPLGGVMSRSGDLLTPEIAAGRFAVDDPAAEAALREAYEREGEGLTATLRIVAAREVFAWVPASMGRVWDGEVVIRGVPVQVTVPGW